MSFLKEILGSIQHVTIYTEQVLNGGDIDHRSEAVFSQRITY